MVKNNRKISARKDPLIGNLFFMTLTVMIVAELSSSVSTLTFQFSGQIAILFGAGETVYLTVQALSFFVISLPIICIKMFYICYFQSAGNKKLSYYSSVAGEFVYLVCSAFLLMKLTEQLVFGSSIRSVS